MHVEEIDVPRDASILGKTLAELNFKQRTGVNVICIVRGTKRVNIPDGNEMIYPFDKVVVAGSDEEIQQFMQAVQEKRQEDAGEEFQQISLSRFTIEKGSPLAGRSIRALKIRERTGCLVIGIDRVDETIAELNADLLLQEGDLLWLAGEQRSLSGFETNLSAAPARNSGVD